MDEILWHRQETRRQTENTNFILRWGRLQPTRIQGTDPFMISYGLLMPKQRTGFLELIVAKINGAWKVLNFITEPMFE